MNYYAKTLAMTLTILLVGCQAINPAPAPADNSLSGADALIENVQTGDSASENGGNSSREVEALNGVGNNVANPNWGSVDQQLIRLVPAEYENGINSPTGADRPSARLISNTFSASPEDGIPNDRDFTAFVYAWGQFLDHDIDLTDTASPKESFSIVVPAGDQWFDPTGSGALTIPMSRSNFDTSAGTNDPRQQINSITAFVDGSQIYGVDAERAAALREFTGGRLRTSAGNLPPLNTEGFANANDAHRVDDNKLFLAGDVRAN